jgi:competence protein ComEC
MRKVLPIIILIAALATGAYVGFMHASHKPARIEHALTVSFLTDNLGNAIVIQTPERHFVVVDPGPRMTSDALAEYLQQVGANSFDVLITTPSAQHAGALEDMIARFSVQRIIHSGRHWRKPFQSTQGPIVEQIVSAGESIKLSPTAAIDILTPRKDAIDPDETRQLVARVRYGDTRFLLTGDALNRDEGYLIRSGSNLTSTVLVAPNHGRSGSMSLELLSKVRPRICVVLAQGSAPPSRIVMNRLKKENSGADLYRTDKDGIIDLVSDGRAIIAETENARR